MKVIESDVNISNMFFKSLPKDLFRDVVVKRSFYCSSNQLTSLEGSPKEVTEFFYCYKNKLTSLVGSPEKVGGSFDCSYNKLTSLEGCPKEVGGNFWCYNNAEKFTEEDVRKVCKVGGIILV